jgi:hypothetical protein
MKNNLPRLLPRSRGSFARPRTVAGSARRSTTSPTTIR